MSEEFSVFAVDDDPFVLDIIRKILESAYPVETFGSAADCLQRLDQHKPDMFLLDVRMPGMDGYALCRSIKDNACLKDIPVTFVSSDDTIEARLNGYDAGGEDFIIKPFMPEEMLRKVRVAHQLIDGKRQVSQQLADSELLSSLVMSNMDEYAILVHFVRQLIALNSESEIAAGLLDMLQRYHLDGVVQTRVCARTLTASARGNDLPLEKSILDHVCTMGRIFEFRSRCVNNYERLTLMINDMPVHDPELCGRLRDHLCIAAECAESQLKTIEIEESHRRNQEAIFAAIEHVSSSTSTARMIYQRDTAACAELLLSLETDFAKAFAHIGMSNRDELRLTDLVDDFSKKMLKLHDSRQETHQAMDDLESRLRCLNPAA